MTSAVLICRSWDTLADSELAQQARMLDDINNVETISIKIETTDLKQLLEYIIIVQHMLGNVEYELI